MEEFGRNDAFMKSFRFLVTFRTEKANLQSDSLDLVIPVLSYLTFLKCKVLNNLAVIWFFKVLKNTSGILVKKSQEWF